MVAAHESSEVREKILSVGQRIIAGKGFSAVGLNEILSSAGVPKGSFYHYFSSKDSFGEALLKRYFEEYLAEIDGIMRRPGLTMAQRLTNYFECWQQQQLFSNCQGKCLAVKLGAEVADLSEAMRLVMKQGTAAVIARLADAIKAGIEEGSIEVDGDPNRVAESLYQLWLGASVMVKIVRNASPLESAMVTTGRILNPSH